MADEFDSDEENKEEASEGEDFGALTGGGDDSGLGNLPPLSDFDSADDSSGGNLPPLGNLDTDSDAGLVTPGTPSDLASPADVKKSTPGALDPGGLITPQFSDAPAFDTPESDLDSPSPADGFGFQDLAADSDFSPETPEIGPGPDSDIDTPMFDSAFGGETGEFGTGEGSPTSSPTQAMDTPMFDASPSPQGGGDFGFDNDAFGGAPAAPIGGGGDDIGTPIPDFSPDTGMPGAAAGATPAPLGEAPKKSAVSKALAVVIPLIALIVGIELGPTIANMAGAVVFLNPFISQLEDKDAIIATKDGTIRRLTAATEGGPDVIDEKTVNELMDKYEGLKTDVRDTEDQLAGLLDQVQERDTHLQLINTDIDEANALFVDAEDALEDLTNETEITKAQHDGLTAENSRLTVAVGELEDADIRRQASKDTLLHNLDLLIVQIEQGIPLTPVRYNRGDRIAKSKALRQRVASANWVEPALLTAYTELYLEELQIGESRDYFFARIPVHDEVQTEEYVWAECLMNGNWSVYYRTIDGKRVGTFENVSATASPEFEFREDLPQSAREEIAEQITAARVDGYEEKITVLEGKQLIYEPKRKLTRTFNSL